MNITVVEGPRTTWFTTLARARGELGISDSSQDETLSNLIGEISDDIVEFTNRLWARQSVTERQIGYGTDTQTLSITPLAHVSEIRLFDTPMSGWSIANREAGFLHRLDLFTDTRRYSLWVTSELDARDQGRQAWAEDYIGGYLMPGDDILPSGVMSALASDSSFNLANVDTEENRFPILVSGEYIRTSGFVNSGNNGRFKVIERTPDKLIVVGTLIDEAPSGIVSMACRTLPRNLEGLALLELRSRYLASTRDPSITSERIGDWSADYSDPASADESDFGGFNPRVARSLLRYQRVE